MCGNGLPRTRTHRSTCCGRRYSCIITKLLGPPAAVAIVDDDAAAAADDDDMSYRWEEKTDGGDRTIVVFYPLPAGLGAKDVDCKVLRQRVTLRCAGETVLDGQLLFKVNPEESYWGIEEDAGQRGVQVVLLKDDKWLKWERLLLDDTAETARLVALWRSPTVWATIEADVDGAGLHALDPGFRSAPSRGG
jgi:hypothetical protein